MTVDGAFFKTQSRQGDPSIFMSAFLVRRVGIMFYYTRPNSQDPIIMRLSAASNAPVAACSESLSFLAFLVRAIPPYDEEDPRHLP